MLAPQTVRVAADEAFRSLRTLRDRVGQGEGVADYESVLGEYDQRFQALREAVRVISA